MRHSTGQIRQQAKGGGKPMHYTLSGLALTIFCSIPLSVKAQVTADGTTSTTVEQDGNNFTIEQGDRIGDNLFHSFEQFSVPTGGSADFNNAADIANIFSRVTGGNVSDIDGLLRANGAANLFLVNPNGIIFGENARLDIGGSFFATSADSLLFEDDAEFSASNPQAVPLLEVSIPIGLSFRDHPGDLVNRSLSDDMGLKVSPGKNISLIGGNIKIEGGSVTAPGGFIKLGGLSDAGTVDIDGKELNFADNLNKANVFLSNNAVVDISSGGGGRIAIDSNSLELTQESQILAGIGAELGSEGAVAGTIEIEATSVLGDNNSQIRSDNLGVGDAGTINITANNLEFVGGSAIVTSTFGRGDAGTVNITAEDVSFAAEWSGIHSNVGLRRVETEEQVFDAVGNGGTINIDTNTLSLASGARLNSSTIAQGDGGNINVNARGAVSQIGQGTTFVEDFDGPVITSIASFVREEGVGDAGNVDLQANSLTLIDKGAIITNNLGSGGNAGDINIEVRDNVFLNQTGLILAQIRKGSTGNGGNIDIKTGSLESLGGSFILADTRGEGNAGNIQIDAAGDILLDERSIILTEVGEGGVGDAGNITIAANSLTSNDSDITTQTLGRGNGGNIEITTDESIVLESDSEIKSLVEGTATGNAGNISLTVGALSLDELSGVASETKGQGNGGEIEINAWDTIAISNNASIRSLVNTGATGNGGDVSLTGKELNLTNSSEIIADNGGTSQGGNINTAGDINIDISGDINLNNGNQIQSQVRGENAFGNAGNIEIKTDGSLFSLAGDRSGNLIIADSQAQGNGGNITITAQEEIRLEGSPGTFPSLIFAGLTKAAEGMGGSVIISANDLVLNNTASISANNTSSTVGQAGSIAIDVENLSLSENAFINAFTANNFDGGAVTINAQNIDLASGGKIIAATNAGGDAGNINLNIGDRIKIDNSVKSLASPVDFGLESRLINDLQPSPSGIYANASKAATGDGGSIIIGSASQMPNSFELTNNAQIVANSDGAGSGGNIFLNSQTLELDNNANILASTTSGTGGEISLQVPSQISLENNSSISAQAFEDADGGNLFIDTGFILAFPNGNSDIIARAARGNGGRISIDTEAIFGLEERLSEPANFTNDIDASSEFGLQGDFTLNIPDLDPVSGLVELPTSVGDASDRISQNPCQQGVASEFVVTGKGGLPPGVSESVNSEESEVGLVEAVDSTSQQTETSKAVSEAQKSASPAQGWVFNDKGEVTLVDRAIANARWTEEKQHNSCSSTIAD